MKKLNYIWILALFLTLIGCNQKSIEIAESIGDPELTQFEQQEVLTIQKNKQNDLYHYPRVLTNSFKGLTLIKQDWKSTFLLCSEIESFILVKKVNSHRYIAISSSEINNTYNFYFYDLTDKGEILEKTKLQKSDYSIDNKYNFIITEKAVYYFTKKSERNEFCYNLENHKHFPSDKNILDWNKIEDLKEHSRFISPNKNHSIELTDVNLIHTNLLTKKVDTLISQYYDGTWSFGAGCWDNNSMKFYFDNSGAVACIWELNLLNKTLDKIVPEHWAKSPILMYDSLDTEILYCEKGCIKKTEFKLTPTKPKLH